eukprot:gene9781-10814_t
MQAKGPSLSSSSASRDGTSGVRVNKCLSHLSRRGADAAIAEGRVTVNGKIALAGQKVNFGDVVKLDGQLQRWEKTAKAKQLLPSTSPDNSLIYIKYFKPIGVTCTSDPNDPSNIIAKGKFHLFPQRLFTVGRLDKDSCGLILLTSDGRVNEALLHRSCKQDKIYEVTMDRTVSPGQLKKLREGVVITTPLQHDGNRLYTARTLPALVSQLDSRTLRITLTEGRNRQIRRMAEAVGLGVQHLLRVSFAGIELRGLHKPGDWCELDKAEMTIIQSAMRRRAAVAAQQKDGQGDEDMSGSTLDDEQ